MVRPTDLHRVYIQMLLARRAMPVEIALEMYKRAVSAVMQNDPDFRPDHSRNSDGLQAFLDEVSNLLEGLGMSIKRGYDETTGRPWLALCNAEGGAVAQQATDLSPLEISYFRAIIEAIVSEYPGFSIGSLAALNLVSELKGKMTKTEAESLLESLVSRNWLLKSKRGRYSLAPRAMLELDHYLRETYGDDLLTCARCTRLMMSGVRCANEDCDAGYHLYCFDRLRGLRGACMQCRTQFAVVEPTPIGERAVPRNEDNFRNLQRKRKRNTDGGVTNGDGGDEDDDDEGSADLEEEEVDMPYSQSQLQSQSQYTQATQATQQQPETGPSRRRTPQETIIPDSLEEDEEEDSQPRRLSRRRR